MGWNGSSGCLANTNCNKKQKTSINFLIKMRAVSIVSLALIVFCIIFFLLKKTECNDGDKKSDIRTRPCRTASSVKTLSQAKLVIHKISTDFVVSVSNQINQSQKVSWIREPLPSNDPDRAFETLIGCELSSLLSIRPGEELPPFPYSFMEEDENLSVEEIKINRKAINDAFDEAIKNFKFVIKDSDSSKTSELKEMIVSSQIEILNELSQGVDVSETIRAAYEFRKAAYETRKTTFDTIVDFIEQNEDLADVSSLLAEANRCLNDMGIIEISPEELGLEVSDFAQ